MFHIYFIYRHECFTGKYTTRKIHKKISHTWVYRWRNFGNFPKKFVGVLRPLNFNYTFFKALLIFCHCRALFSAVLFLKIIVNNVLYCCTENVSRHNYFLAHKNLLFYLCLFVYIIKRTLRGGWKIWILFSRGKNNILLAALVCKILFCHSKIKFTSSRHRVISSMYWFICLTICTLFIILDCRSADTCIWRGSALRSNPLPFHIHFGQQWYPFLVGPLCKSHNMEYHPPLWKTTP